MQLHDRAVEGQQGQPDAQAPSELGALGAPDSLLHMLSAGALYFAAAYAALWLAAGPDGVALYWPASGVAVGLLLALGPRSYSSILIGVLVATVVANVMFDHSFALSLVFGVCNAGEALTTVWLRSRLEIRKYRFRRLALVLVFFASGAAGCAVAALPAAIALDWTGASSAGLSKLWLSWLLSDFVGIAVVAPLIVAVLELARAPVRKYDWRLDIVLLLLFTFAAHDSFSLRLDSGNWQALAPGATILPILIWIAARSQPIVPALAVALLGGMMEGFAVTETGRYGDVRVPFDERALAAQITLSIASFLTLSVSALFAGQRSVEARLRASEERLALVAAAAPGVIFTLERAPDGKLMLPFVSGASAELLGIDAEQLAADPDALLARLDEADRRALIDALTAPDVDAGVLRYELPLRKADSSEIWLEISARSNRGVDGRTTWHGFIHDITARRRLLDELNHRTRNLLTVVQAVAEHTARRTPPHELADKLGERLAGLAASHQLLAARSWEGVEIETLVASQLAHLESLFGSRLVIGGPSLTLKPQAAQIIGMAVHELATNACKHGALSQQGSVHLTWAVPPDDPAQIFKICWEERGGPPYPIDRPRGFGQKVLIEMAAYQLAAHVVLDSQVDGLAWRLTAPRRHVILEQARTML